MHAFAAARIGKVPRVRWLGPVTAFFFLACGFLSSAEDVDARGSRGARFADAERAITITEPALAPPDISPCTVQPAYPAGSLGGLFSRPGLLGGFAAGFLGAGVFGLLFGLGVIGKLSGLPSILGLVFQFALLLAFGWLIWAWWRVDRTTAVTELSPRQLADAYERARNEMVPDMVGADDAKDRKELFAGKEHSRG